MQADVLAIQQQFGAQLHNIICKKVNHADHCHDIMQEVYLKIMLNLPGIGKAKNIAGYLVQIANNTVTDHFRKSKTGIETSLPENIGMREDLCLDQSLQLADCCLRPMIDSLPAIYSEALVKTELDGMKYKDYAEYAGISLSNAKVRVQRAKEKLKEAILQCCNYEFDHYGNIVDCTYNGKNSCCKK